MLRERSAKPTYRCCKCKYEGPAEYIWDGSYVRVLVLGLFFVVPALVYVIYLYLNRFPVCPVCASGNLIRVGKRPD